MDDEDNTSDYKQEPVDTVRGAFMSYVDFFKALKVAWGESKGNTFMEFLRSLKVAWCESGGNTFRDLRPLKVTAGRIFLWSFISLYMLGGGITGVITFIGVYIFCITKVGALLGVLLGWLPSMFAAAFVAVFWPIIALALLHLLQAQ